MGWKAEMLYSFSGLPPLTDGVEKGLALIGEQ
jgi:hypothetical protein